MEDIIFSLAKSEKEKEEALFLVEKEYAKQGYIDPKNPEHKLKISPESITFVAKIGEKIVGTVSIALDSESGLPMDKIYKKELDGLRKKNKKIVEVCRLAVDNTVKEKYNNFFLLSSLFKLVFHYCIYKNFDNICISINPKHNLFYKSLSFKKIGGLKNYPQVNNAPAIARTLDIKNLESKNIKNYLFNKLFFENPPDYKIFE